MDMKTKIMQKLFEEKPLTNEEILYIGANLGDSSSMAEGLSRMPAYKHDEKDSLSKACGLTQTDFDSINALITSEVTNRKDEVNCDSKQVEIYERIALSKPQHFRVLMYQFVKMKVQASRNPMNGINIQIGRRDGGSDDFKDFLDKLRGL